MIFASWIGMVSFSSAPDLSILDVRRFRRNIQQDRITMIIRSTPTGMPITRMKNFALFCSFV